MNRKSVHRKSITVREGEREEERKRERHSKRARFYRRLQGKVIQAYHGIKSCGLGADPQHVFPIRAVFWRKRLNFKITVRQVHVVPTVLVK